MEERRKPSSQARAIRAKRQRQKRAYKQNKAGMFWVAGIVLILLIVVSIKILGMYQENRALRARETEVMAELETEQERQEEIQEYGKYVNTFEYIEQLAKSKLGLLYPNEIVFKEQKQEP